MSSTVVASRPALAGKSSLPPGYTIRVEDNGGVNFYRALRVNGPEWVSSRLHGTYSAAETDAHLHSVGVRP